MSKRLKTAMLSALLVSAAAITVYAADPTPTPPPPQNPPQVAKNPGNAPATGFRAGVGPSTTTSANPSGPAASASGGIRSEDSTYYSKKGFGPAPN